MKQKGFTLIELLVVIAIIGVLAAVVLVSLNSSRSKGRDAKRLADIQQLMKAVELYYNQYGGYPPSGGATNGPNAGWSNSSDASWLEASAFPAAMAPYISKLPLDPLNQAGWRAGTYQYSYVSCGRSYMIVYILENPGSLVSPGVNYCGIFYNYGGTGVMTVGVSSTY